MRLVLSAVAVGLLVGFGSFAADPQPGAVTKEQIEADLKLVPKVVGETRVIEAGTQPHVEFTLVNTSKTRTHKVVKPGDGSECGWRDPWVHVTAEQRGVDGKWAALERNSYGRCGLYDADWPKDVIDLKPGEELSLKNWYSPHRFEFQYPGKVRLTGHYEYRAVGGKGGKERPDADRGRMAGVPLFAVHSEPVEFEVVRSFDVRVKVKKALKVGVETKLSEVLEVTVTNASKEPRTVGDISQNDYRLSVSPLSDGATTPALADAPVYSSTKVLKPGETVIVFGGGVAGAADGMWKGLKAGTTRVRVNYGIPTGSSATHVVSADAEVRVVE